MVNNLAQLDIAPSAMIKLAVDGKEERFTAADGEAPEHALDKVLRKALEVFYPELREVHISDYKSSSFRYRRSYRL